MQQRHQTQEHQRQFTASEVAEFEYCPLAWWYEQFEPSARADDDELFARMVELEHEHGAQAPALPEYQMLERLLLRRGAFDEGQERHFEHAQEVEAAQEERRGVSITGRMRQVTIAIVVLVIVAALLIGIAIVLR